MALGLGLHGVRQLLDGLREVIIHASWNEIFGNSFFNILYVAMLYSIQKGRLIIDHLTKRA